MGSASSKFKKYLQHGDEFAAMQVFQSSPELRKNLDPNLSYGDSHQHNTALHYAAKHGMKHLLRTFLNDLGGNPNKKNANNETSLHAACQLGQQKSFSAQERRAACVGLLLQWRGTATVGSGRERVDLRAQDHKGNTALHCAANCGLKRCVELLLAHGSPLFLENQDKQTPCDLAMRSSHHDIARLLESRMVFADSSDSINEAELYGEVEEVYSGLRTQDLQEAKDQLLVETSDMLHIPLFTAEALLRDNEWSREALLDKWMKDPVQCCLLAGVQPPATALQHCGPDITPLEPEVCPPPPSEPICEICMMAMPCWDWPVQMSCGHRFCSACWERYLTVKIQDGDAHHILCPAYQCHMLVPVEVIEKLVSPDMARRYLQFDIKAFVESNRCIKWCPMPGCGRAVRLPETEQLPPRKASPPPTSHAVDCGNGHFFCWECLGEAHAPSSCPQWQQWQHKISEVRFEELRASCTETEDAANCLWLVTNSKPCPNCKSPIQKNEGCNHMKCSKCKCDFCWVCLENWKKHSSATGGYFRCNRFEAVHKADEKQGLLISEAVVRNQQMQELNRFLHYYTRFRNHENSHRLEEPLLGNARQKMELLASSVVEPKRAGTRFVEDGVRELLKARRVLCGSYVHGYYLQDNGYNRTIFEFMQNELEEVTEKLSEMVARPYLRTPRALIIQTTALARRKRHEFVRAVAKGLIPPESPPPARRRPHDDMTHAIAASLQLELDPEAQSRGHALYDWPEVDSDDDQLQETLAISLLGECSRAGCSRPRARIPRTAAVHHFCSLRCSRLAAASQTRVDDVFRVNVTADYNMDLVIALEMSRLQMIEDEMKKRQREDVAETSVSVPVAKEATDDQQLKLAIELSLQDGDGSYQRTPADLTVDCFLRSLAGRPLLEVKPEHSGGGGGPSAEWGCEDGRFEIGDLHQNGWVEGGPGGSSSLKRSHSTGDLCTRPTLLFAHGAAHRAEPRYHLDSDHSSQHEERPEDAAHAGVHQVLLLHHPTGGSSVYYGGQSSVEDTTTTSDSLNADLEVCGILGTTTEDEEGGGLSCLEEDVGCSPAPPPPLLPPPLLVPEGLRAPPQPSALRIHICRSPGRRPLETDSSNEYESETGIPRSPTLFISGVSISRTPEPRSPGRTSRSASLSAAPGTPPALPVPPPPLSSPALTTPPALPPPSPLQPAQSAAATQAPPPTPPKSRSASEPERERQVFRFPKSSTDGALSSVLLVQESNLSSDDFHEALFLLEPKAAGGGGGSKRRKKSKKERHKEASSAL